MAALRGRALCRGHTDAWASRGETIQPVTQHYWELCHPEVTQRWSWPQTSGFDPQTLYPMLKLLAVFPTQRREATGGFSAEKEIVTFVLGKDDFSGNREEEWM